VWCLNGPHMRCRCCWPASPRSPPPSTDETTRAKDSDVAYLRNAFALIEFDWDRAICAEYLAERGSGHTVKSACLGCPFHDNASWRWIRDHDPPSPLTPTGARHGPVAPAFPSMTTVGMTTHPPPTTTGHHLTHPPSVASSTP
jgi:hypothetical protein